MTEKPTVTMKMRKRPVTPEEAAESVQRLINSHFNNQDRAHCQIPVSVKDDDVVASDYVIESAAELMRLRLENARLNNELDTGDSWQWIRRKFDACGAHLKWFKPRADGLRDTRYELMGWLHVLFAEAHPHVYIDITLEHQKRTDEAEAESRRLRAALLGVRQWFANLDAGCESGDPLKSLREQAHRPVYAIIDAALNAPATSPVPESK